MEKKTGFSWNPASQAMSETRIFEWNYQLLRYFVRRKEIRECMELEKYRSNSKCRWWCFSSLAAVSRQPYTNHPTAAIWDVFLASYWQFELCVHTSRTCLMLPITALKVEASCAHRTTRICWPKLAMQDWPQLSDHTAFTTNGLCSLGDLVQMHDWPPLQ